MKHKLPFPVPPEYLRLTVSTKRTVFATLAAFAILVGWSDLAAASSAAGLGAATAGIATITNAITGVLTGTVGKGIIGVALIFIIYKMIFGEHGVRLFLPWFAGVGLLAGAPYLVNTLMPGSGLAI